MAQFYTDPSREGDTWSLPDAEAFHVDTGDITPDTVFWPEGEEDIDPADYVGWYWWACFPGCLPDSEPVGPFRTEQEAIEDAREDC